MSAHIGELAALGTAVSWTVAALIMEKAVKRVGVMAVNTLKVTFGSVYLAALAFFLMGSPVPRGLSLSSWGFLGASGLVGFVIGDYFLLHAYDWIGSRLSMLLLALSVPFTALGAFAVFGEAPGPWALAGMALCVGGIVLTVLAGNRSGPAGQGTGSGRYWKGIAYGILSAIAMACATLLTKAGASGVSSVSATQVRIGSALAGFLAFAFATGKAGEIASAVRDRKGLRLIATASVFGPFIGVGLLLFAIQHADAGVVSTLSSLTPVLIIPPSMLIFGRRVGALEIVGSCAAVAGLALFFVG
jgi:drug/metabolite transporter (DMT)-like permease